MASNSNKIVSEAEETMLAFGGFRRGGSSIGFMILQHLLMESGLSCNDLVKEMSDRGVNILTGRHVLPALRSTQMVGCFRTAPVMSTKSLARTRLFLLVRDPRDCQMSWYHARHLHQQDGTESVIVDGASIDQDLIKDESFDADVTSLLDWCELSGGRIFRYEDMVMNPLAFILEFAEFSGLRLKRSAIDLALIEASFFQPALDHTDHNRSGTPYQALRTLSQSQLKKLNKRFAPLLTRLDYPLKPEDMPKLDLATLVQRDASKRYIHTLAEQNGRRISEIAELKQEVAVVRSRTEQHIRDLPEQNGLRIVEIAELKRTLEMVRAEIEQPIRDLPEQNEMRIAEIAELKQALASVRSEVDQLKQLLRDRVDFDSRSDDTDSVDEAKSVEFQEVSPKFDGGETLISRSVRVVMGNSPARNGLQGLMG